MTMQLGKSLVGALVGGALGIVVLVLVHALTGWDRYWMAIPVAIATGLGVRCIASTKGHPSYVRGVLTGIISILAFLAGQYVVAEVATRLSRAKPITADLSDVSAADTTDDADAAGDSTETGEADAAETGETDALGETDEAADAGAAAEGDEAAADDGAAQPAEDDAAAQPAEEEAAAQPPVAEEAPRQVVPNVGRIPRPQQWSTFDLISLCVAALVGYALGRGSDGPPYGENRDDDIPAPNRAMPPSD
jgi:hypothetical protein